jgi:hypothetical protein
MFMTSIRFPVVVSLFVTLLLAIIISNVPVADSHSNGSASRAGEQVSSAEKSLASSTVGYASQQTSASGDYIFALAAHRFEPLLLLLLGSTLLIIGSAIRLLLSRRLRRNPGLLKNDK